MYLPKLRELKEAVTSLITKPYTTKFPAVPFTAAEEYRGKPRFNKEECVGCGTCAQVCPANAIEVNDDTSARIRTLTISYYSCINCGQCEENCITEKGVKLSNEHSFATFRLDSPEMFEKVDKKILLCEICGNVIAAADHIALVYDRLGSKAFAHPLLMLNQQKEYVDYDLSIPKSRIRREDQVKQVCPKCRQKVVIEDEFYTLNTA